MASYRLLAIASLTALVTTLSGAASAAPPTVDRAAAGKAGRASVTTVGSPQQTVRLATGERLELMRDPTRSASPFRVLPAGDSARPGRFAYGAADGKLRVQPTGHRAETVQLRAGTRSSATARADAYYPVKLTINSPTGFGSKLIYVWDRRNWTAYAVNDEQFTPNGSTNLPNGDYFAVALYTQWGGGSFLLTRTFQIANGGATVRFDQSTAKETRIAVDDPTATRYTSAVWISVPGGLAGFAGGGAEKVYVTPYSVAGTSLRLHDILIKQGTSDFVPSPYRYDLYRSFDDAVPATPVVNLTRTGLAVTTTSVRGQGRATNASLLTVPYTSDWTGAYLPSPVAVPGTVTEYVTPERSFMRLLHYRPLAQDMTLRDRALPPGPSAGETIGGAPFAPRWSPGTGSSRDITRMYIYEYPALSDAAGNPGIDRNAKVSINLSSGGEPHISASDLSPYQSVSATVPSVSTVYQLNHTVTRVVSWSRLSTEVRSEWRFLSAGVRYSDPLPLVDIGFATAGLDTQNTVRLAPVKITATASSRRSGALATLTGLEYSTDDGATWAALPVSGSADRASVDLTVPSTAAFVSLRSTATDDSGGTLRRTVIRAFAGPASQADETVGATKVSNVVVNGGKPVVLTSSGAREFTATFTATDPSGIAGGDVYLWRNPSRSYVPRGSSSSPNPVLVSGWAADCTETSATTATCQATFRADPKLSLGRNDLAGGWRVAVRAHSKDGMSFTDRRSAGSFSMLRHSKLTTSAAPTSVAKGKTFAVKGVLTQASWERTAYTGYPGQAVTLQFQKAGTSTYTTVKTVTLDQYGEATVKVTASASGSWRYVFAGTSTTAAVTSSSVYVTVT
ncbi:hypothetical protein [Micromonospora sp. NPDC003776]